MQSWPYVLPAVRLKKGGEKKRKGSCIFRGRETLKNKKNKNKISPWPSSIPPLHHPSLRFPSFSPWSCLHGNPLRASRPWVCACLSACVCESVWAGKLVQGTKLRAFFVPVLPLVNLSQALQGSSGREREGREQERESVCVYVCDSEIEREREWEKGRG